MDSIVLMKTTLTFITRFQILALFAMPATAGLRHPGRKDGAKG